MDYSKKNLPNLLKIFIGIFIDFPFLHSEMNAEPKNKCFCPTLELVVYNTI